MVLTHLLLKEKINLNRPSILTPTEVEVVVEAKVVAGANLEKVNQIREIQVAGETSPETGGVKEVEVREQIGNKNAADSRECWTCGEKGHMSRDCPKEKRVERENRATMHLLAMMQVTAEASACLLCNM